MIIAAILSSIISCLTIVRINGTRGTNDQFVPRSQDSRSEIDMAKAGRAYSCRGIKDSVYISNINLLTPHEVQLLFKCNLKVCLR